MPTSSFALLTTQVEMPVYGRIAHRAGTAPIHFLQKHYSCFYMGGKKDSMNAIKKEGSGGLWHCLCAVGFSILLCPAQ